MTQGKAGEKGKTVRRKSSSGDGRPGGAEDGKPSSGSGRRRPREAAHRSRDSVDRIVCPRHRQKRWPRTESGLLFWRGSKFSPAPGGAESAPGQRIRLRPGGLCEDKEARRVKGLV